MASRKSYCADSRSTEALPTRRYPKKIESCPGPRRAFKVAGLFAGIGGIELGFQRAGHETTLLCELEPGARAVLDFHFPTVRKHDDVCTLQKLPRGTSILTGGFPCQDLSQAGKTKGITGVRSGLVGEVFRLLSNQRVPWVVLENVPFMLQLARGEALEVIVAAFEHLGYKWAYRVLDSRSMGLPQRRERIYFVASLDEDPRAVLLADDAGEPEETRNFPEVACGFYWTEGLRGLGWAVDAVPTIKSGSTIGIPSPPAIVLPSGEVVRPDIRDAERMQGFPADWTTPTTSVMRSSHRWKLVGNAVSVDVAEWIAERIALPGVFSEPALTQPILPRRSWPRAGWNVGNGRMTADFSAWPVRRPRLSLQAFLEHPTELLSARASAGFLERAHRASLRFAPGFLEAVSKHRDRMERLRRAA